MPKSRLLTDFNHLAGIFVDVDGDEFVAVATAPVMVVADIEPNADAVVFIVFVGIAVKMGGLEEGAEDFVATHLLIHISTDGVGHSAILIGYHIHLNPKSPLDGLIDNLIVLAVEVGFELFAYSLHIEMIWFRFYYNNNRAKMGYANAVPYVLFTNKYLAILLHSADGLY